MPVKTERTGNIVKVAYSAEQLAEILRPHVVEDAKGELAGWEAMIDPRTFMSCPHGVTVELDMCIEVDRSAEKSYRAEAA
jgi:hypothetical protein